MYKGKYALITGSSRGVGLHIAEHFLRNNAIVIGFARGDSNIKSVNYHHIKTNLGEADSIINAFTTVRKITNKLDIVINNAAVLTSQYAMIMPPSAVQDMLNVNLFGVFMVSREAAKVMRKNKWGRIVNIGSMAASLEPIGDSVYAACKAGVSKLANVMAKEFSPFNVTCNTLGINAIDSDMLSQLPRDKIEDIIHGLPIPRFSNPDDILNIIDFYCSERSSSITAQTIFLGGVN